jgi:ParB/RepB/Spo0J family partition protein
MEAAGGAVGAELLDQELESIPESEKPADEAAEVAAFKQAARRTAMVPVSLIRKSDTALRGVQRQTEKYQLLLQSVKRHGVLNSITVCERVDPATKTKFYALVDGLQRFTAASDAGLTEVPASIVDIDDAEILEAQIVTNLNRIDTRPADVSKHLLRILARNPYMTKQQLCERVCQSITWVEQRLGLANLKPEIQELVNLGKIHLTNAYSLSKVDEEEQLQHVEAAMTESPKTFVPRMKQRVKELRDARKSGGDAGEATFQPVQYMQKVGDVKNELANGCPILSALIQKHAVTDPVDAAKLALAWALHFDQDSQDEQRREHDAKVKKREEEKERMKAEREEKKQKDAAAARESIEKGW